jgi:pyruvate,water dikinase
MKTAYLLSFAEGSRYDLALLGGKGGNLCELVRLGLPVPDGFCVTTAAYRAFMESHPQQQAVTTLLERLIWEDLQLVHQTGNEVRSLLKDGPIPPQFEEELAIMLSKFPSDARFAVRSSATAEDLPEASFAGQLDTYLNVQGLKSLLAHIQDCWISLFTDRAMIYRNQQGYRHQDVQLAVVVQLMVASEASGILFTADPLTSNRDQLVINAGYGLGEALVSGLITPDTYSLSKTHPDQLTCALGSKQIAIQYDPQGGTRQIPLSDEMQASQVLNNAEIQSLAQLGLKIEQHYNAAQDIEWAKVGKDFYILQTRPITTLFPIPEPRPVDGSEHVYVSFGHAQMMTDPLSPLGISMLHWILPFGKTRRNRSQSKYLCQAGSRLYIDATELVFNPLLRPKILSALKVADPLITSGLQKIPAPRPKGSLLDLINTRHLLRWVLPVALKAAYLWIFANAKKDTQTLAQKMQHRFAELEMQIEQADSSLSKLLLLNSLSDQKMTLALIHFPPRLAAGMISLHLIPRLLPNENVKAEILAIQRSIHGNITTEMDMQIGDLANLVRQDQQDSPALLNLSPAEAAQRILAILKKPENQPQWLAFMEQYGFRGPGEIDIASPRWQENPLGLTNMLLGNLTNHNGKQHRQRIQEIHQTGNQAAEHLLHLAARQSFGGLKSFCMRRCIHWIRYGLGIREHPKYFIMKMMALIKKVYLDLGEQWAAEQNLETADDIFWLSARQILAALQGESIDLKQRAAQNHQKWLRYKKIKPPRVITSSGFIPAVTYQHEDLPAGALAGNPVSAGIVEGTARVILDPHSESLLPGEILIAPFTDPGWTPLFIHAAGLVMELGGSMTHGSVVAREYGIPAVAGVNAATQIIQSGMRIRVDGNLGYVEILHA